MTGSRNGEGRREGGQANSVRSGVRGGPADLGGIGLGRIQIRLSGRHTFFLGQGRQTIREESIVRFKFGSNLK